MRAVRVISGVSAAAIALIGSHGTAPPAQAEDYGIAINGTYRATSNGDWAQSSQGPYGAGGARVYRDEATKIETWTVTSDCVSPLECYGEVRSDAGWTGVLEFNGKNWFVDRDIENWEPCPDGTAAPGHQSIGLWNFDPSTSLGIATFRDLLVGFEKTQAQSGACGVSKPLIIQLPMRVEKLS